MEKVKPCPFCGKQVNIYESSNSVLRGWYMFEHVEHPNCNLTVGVLQPDFAYAWKEAAIAEWNKRSGDQWRSMDDPSLEEHKDGRPVLFVREIDRIFGEGTYKEIFVNVWVSQINDWYTSGRNLYWMPIPEMPKETSNAKSI